MNIHSELVALKLDEHLLATVQHLVTRLARQIDWREFGRIPGRRRTAGPLRARAELKRRLREDRYAFLEWTAVQEQLIDRLAARGGVGMARVFRLLCLSEQLSRGELQEVLTPQEIDQFVMRGLLIEHGGRIACAVRFVPYGDHFYLTDSLLLGDNKLTQGIQPVYLSMETHAQIEHLKQMLAGRRLRRSLEVGCGTGLVTLELRDLVEMREGGDLHARSVEFAQLNKALRGDENARFYESDLLKAAQGKFDLIIFNPFKITVETLDFLYAFLEQSFDKLEPDGHLLLVFHAQMSRGRDPVFEALRDAVMNRWQRSIRRTFLASSLGDDGSVHSISFLWMSRPKRAPELTYDRNRARLSWLLRRLYVRLRGR